MNNLKFSDLVGKTLRNVIVSTDTVDFVVSDTEQYRLCHLQECCEHVSVEDVNGEITDLIGSPILVADESSSNDDPKQESYEDSCTWTFYRIATVKGWVVIRFYGEYNGYYSESVDFCKL